MNFGAISGIGGAVAGYLQTPEGQDAVKKFLASPEGTKLLQNFLGTSEGKQTLGGMLPGLLAGLDIPAGAPELIAGALKSQK
jgi:hypothetical protein